MQGSSSLKGHQLSPCFPKKGWSYPPKDKVVVFPAVAQLKNKLLPNMGHSSQSAMIVVNQAQA